MYVYIQTEPGLFTVGHYTPKGEFYPESEWATRAQAARRVNYLNGGSS
jgi:hypothetical protein